MCPGSGTARVAIVLLLAMILVSCGERGHDQGLSYIQPDPCAPPCWQNITPGRTLKNEALQTLRGIPWLDVVSIEEFAPAGSKIDEYLAGSEISWYSRSSFVPGRQGNVRVSEDGVVESISVYFDRTGPGVTVPISGLIDLYGPPVVQLRAHRINLFQTRFELFLYYPETGLYLIGGFYGAPGSDPPIPSSITVGTIEYIAPDDFYRIAGLLPGCSVPWNGYREASYYCQCSGLPLPPEWTHEMCPPWQ